MAEQFAFVAEDPDVEVGDQDDDAAAAVGAADAYVVEFGSVAQGEHSASSPTPLPQ